MTTMPFYPISVPQYHEMLRCGILTENDRCELIRGQLVPKMTIVDDHAACVDQLNWLLNQGVPDDVRVRIQNPVVLADSEPEPDVSLVRVSAGKLRTKKPQAIDVLLLIEGADSTYDFDRQEKIPLYAENDIPEVWLVDLRSRAVEVFRTPTPTGYSNVSRLTGTDQLSVLTLSGVHLSVGDVLDFE
jgi:Uma2 family endonuclease